MRLDRIEGLVADIMLDSAGILRGSFLVDTNTDQKLGENGMTLIYSLGDLFT